MNRAEFVRDMTWPELKREEGAIRRFPSESSSKDVLVLLEIINRLRNKSETQFQLLR